MGDLTGRILDHLSLYFGVPPWIVVLSLVFIVALFIGISLVLRERMTKSNAVDWNRDPEEMQDLSPRLRQARLQMIGAAIAMVAIFAIAVMNFLEP